jgi:hypothetical protein
MIKKADANLPALPDDIRGFGDIDEKALVAGLDHDGPTGTATADDVKDAMGTQRPQLERIDILHGESRAFKFPDGDLVKGADGFVGVMAAYTYHNAFFAKPFKEREEGERPVCASANGVSIKASAPEPQNPEGGCVSCPRNRDARDQRARDEAFDRPRKETCGNFIAVAVAVPGVEVPYLLRIPVSSFGPFASYAQAIGTRGRFQLHEVATKFRLATKTNRAGIKYSQLELEQAGPLPTNLRAAFTKENPAFVALLRQDYTEQGAGAGEVDEAIRRAEAAEAENAGKPAAL